MERPRWQKALEYILWVLTGFVALGTILDAAVNAISIVTPPIAIVGTLLLLGIGLLARSLLPIIRPKWITRDGSQVRIRRVGPLITFGIAGMILLLWFPTLINVLGGKAEQGMVGVVEGTPTFSRDDKQPTATVTRRDFSPATSTRQATVSVTTILASPTRMPEATVTSTAVQSSPTERTRPIDEMSMILVPEGAFLMGSNARDVQAQQDEFPQHEVTLSSFWIDQTEVTNRQYNFCIENGFCEKLLYTDDERYNGEDLPVVGATWEDADNYCTWVGGRLPTEAEWEYAAKGPDSLRYPWGNVFNSQKLNYCDRNCNTEYRDLDYDDGYALTAPVGSFSDGASWIGVLDMAGNVWEWTGDWYGPYSSEDQTDPTGPPTEGIRVLRGGGWNAEDNFNRTTFRFSEYGPDVETGDVGFRCVMSAEE